MLELLKELEENVKEVDTRLTGMKNHLKESQQMALLVNNGANESNVLAVKGICDMVSCNLSCILANDYMMLDSLFGNIELAVEEIKEKINKINTKSTQVVKNNKTESESKPTAKRGRKPNSNKESTKVETKPQTLQDIFKEN